MGSSDGSNVMGGDCIPSFDALGRGLRGWRRWRACGPRGWMTQRGGGPLKGWSARSSGLWRRWGGNSGGPIVIRPSRSYLYFLAFSSCCRRRCGQNCQWRAALSSTGPGRSGSVSGSRCGQRPRRLLRASRPRRQRGEGRLREAAVCGDAWKTPPHVVSGDGLRVDAHVTSHLLGAIRYKDMKAEAEAKVAEVSCGEGGRKQPEVDLTRAECTTYIPSHTPLHDVLNVR